MRNRAKKRKPRLTELAVILSAAITVGVIERKIPFGFSVPGVRLGLSNAVILTAIYIFPVRDAVKISALKWMVVSIFTGFGVSAFYGLAGSTLSFVIMASAVSYIPKENISPVGVSVLGALAHNLGQITACAAVMRSFAVAIYIPVLALSGVVTGILVGIAVKYLLSVHTRIVH